LTQSGVKVKASEKFAKIYALFQPELRSYPDANRVRVAKLLRAALAEMIRLPSMFARPAFLLRLETRLDFYANFSEADRRDELAMEFSSVDCLCFSRRFAFHKLGHPDGYRECTARLF
jgi:hypothetical protein